MTGNEHLSAWMVTLTQTFAFAASRREIISGCVWSGIEPCMSFVWRRLATLILILLLASCGDSGESERGIAQQQSVWSYVAVGDSLAVGAIAEEGYVPRYASLTKTDTGKDVRTTNFGVSGWTSADLLNGLRNDARMRTALTEAQVITFDIGGNDLLRAHRLFLERNCGGADNLECFRTAVTEFRSNWDAIIAELLALRNPDTAIVRTMNIYNPFVTVQKAAGTLGVLRPFLDDVNAHITQSAASNRIKMADVYVVFNGPAHDQDAALNGLISFDGVHPDDDGHEAIAQALRGLRYSPLQ